MIRTDGRRTIAHYPISDRGDYGAAYDKTGKAEHDSTLCYYPDSGLCDAGLHPVSHTQNSEPSSPLGGVGSASIDQP